jgi:HK97 family phage major capsid protein
MEIAELKTAVDGYHAAASEAVKAIGGRLDGIEKRLNRPGVGGGDGNREDEVALKSFGTYLRRGTVDDEMKAMTVGSDPDGGYAVVTPLANTITKRIYETSPIRQVARVVTVEADAFEELLDADDAAATWVGETDARPETASPKLGKLRIPVHEIYANPKASQTLLEDASTDIGAWLEGKVADRFGRSENAAFVNGNGVGKPRGFLTYPTAATADAVRPWGTLQHVVTGEAATFIAPTATASPVDCLIDLMTAVKAGYRPRAAWLMNRATAGVIRKFKDPEGRFVWTDPLMPGALPTLLGFPVYLAEDMPDIAAGKYPVAFGDFQAGYTVVDRIGIQVLRDPFTAKPFVVFYTRKRVGGDVNNSEAIKLLKIAAL